MRLSEHDLAFDCEAGKTDWQYSCASYNGEPPWRYQKTEWECVRCGQYNTFPEWWPREECFACGAPVLPWEVRVV